VEAHPASTNVKTELKKIFFIYVPWCEVLQACYNKRHVARAKVPLPEHGRRRWSIVGALGATRRHRSSRRDIQSQTFGRVEAVTESNVKWGFLAVGLLTAAPLMTAAPLAGQGEGWEVSIAVGGGEVIAGESLNETSPGYAYVYRKDSGGVWAEVQRLEASNSSPGDHFGRTVTLSGDQLLVGSTLLEAIYVFEKDGSDQWRETQILTVSDAYQGNSIGRISAADGDHFFTASWTNSESRGAVYAFERDPATGRWSETDKLMGSDVGPNESFGMSIAVEGDVALIGTPRKDNGTGAAYVFRRDETTGEWSEQSKLVVPGTSPNSGFGVAVGLDGGVALIAAAGVRVAPQDRVGDRRCSTTQKEPAAEGCVVACQSARHDLQRRCK